MALFIKNSEFEKLKEEVNHLKWEVHMLKSPPFKVNDIVYNKDGHECVVVATHQITRHYHTADIKVFIYEYDVFNKHTDRAVNNVPHDDLAY